MVVAMSIKQSRNVYVHFPFYPPRFFVRWGSICLCFLYYFFFIFELRMLHRRRLVEYHSEILPTRASISASSSPSKLDRSVKRSSALSSISTNYRLIVQIQIMCCSYLSCGTKTATCLCLFPSGWVQFHGFVSDSLGNDAIVDIVNPTDNISAISRPMSR